MDALFGVVGNELGGRVVGVEFDLVYCWDDLERVSKSTQTDYKKEVATNLGSWVVEQLLQVLDCKVGDTNVLYFASGWQLLNLLPRLDEIPIREMLLQICGVGGARPVHEVQINVIDAQGFQGGVNALLDTFVPWVVELGGDPDLFAGNPGVLDTKSDFGLVAVGKLDIHQHGFPRVG